MDSRRYSMQIKIPFLLNGQELPTVERSTKIRFGKNCTNDQAKHSCVQCSNVELDVNTPGSIY